MNFRITTDGRGVTRFPNLIKGIQVTALTRILVSSSPIMKCLKSSTTSP